MAPYPHTYHFRVKPAEAGATLLGFLRERFPFRSETGWVERIADGRITCNGSTAAPDQILAAGDNIEHFNPKVTEPSVPDSVRVVEESADYLAVYKPAPMPVHPGGRYFRNTLTSILEVMGHPGLHLVHRLDSVTSGLMLIAKNQAFSREATRLFTAGEVVKTYHAVVSGRPDDDAFSCDEPILRDRGFRFRCDDAGKPALTRFRVLHRDTSHSLVECEPVTGRTHQIRLHLAQCEFPVCDDHVYQTEGRHELQQTAICLQSSGIRIPELGIDIQIDIPKSWKIWFGEPVNSRYTESVAER